MRHFFICCALLSTVGCQVYQPTPVAQIAPNQTVRVTLNDDGRKVVQTAIGPQVNYLQGTIIAHDSTSLTMRVNLIKRLTTAEEKYSTPRQVVVPLNAITSAGIEKTSVGRTSLLAGIGAAGLILIGNSLSDGGIFGRGGPDHPTPGQ